MKLAITQRPDYLALNSFFEATGLLTPKDALADFTVGPYFTPAGIVVGASWQPNPHPVFEVLTSSLLTSAEMRRDGTVLLMMHDGICWQYTDGVFRNGAALGSLANSFALDVWARAQDKLAFGAEPGPAPAPAPVPAPRPPGQSIEEFIAEQREKYPHVYGPNIFTDLPRPAPFFTAAPPTMTGPGPSALHDYGMPPTAAAPPVAAPAAPPVAAAPGPMEPPRRRGTDPKACKRCQQLFTPRNGNQHLCRPNCDGKPLTGPVMGSLQPMES